MYRKHFRYQAHRRQDDDIYLRVAKEPEQVLVQYRAAAHVVERLPTNEYFTEEEARAQTAVEHDQEESRNQYRERQQAQDSCDEESPDGQRQAPHSHAFRTQIEHRSNIVDTAEQYGDYEEDQAEDPQGHACARPRGSLRQRAKRRVSRPAAGERPGVEEKGEKHDYPRQEKEPIGEHIQERRSHIPGTNLQGDEQVAERAAQTSGEYKEYQDGTVHRYQRIVEFWCQRPHASIIDGNPLAQHWFEPSHTLLREAQLEAEHQRHQRADNRPEHPRDQELLGDDFVILAKNIGSDKIGLVLITVMMLVKMVIITVLLNKEFLFGQCRFGCYASSHW